MNITADQIFVNLWSECDEIYRNKAIDIALNEIDNLVSSTIKNTDSAIKKDLKNLMMFVRLCITGQPSGMSLFHMLVIIGKEKIGHLLLNIIQRSSIEKETLIAFKNYNTPFTLPKLSYTEAHELFVYVQNTLKSDAGTAD